MIKFIFKLINSLFNKEKEEETEDNMSGHHDFVAPNIKKYDHQLLKNFKDGNRIIENDWHYRKGAAYTAPFGITDGWGANMEPGYVRIHPGVDRANGGSVKHGDKTIEDIVICPLNFDSSSFIDYNGRSYGSLVFLTSTKYHFDMRIAHMHPQKNIIPWTLKQFKNRNRYKQNWLIGSAGTYGYSTGEHTHTELVSHDEACEIFELLLNERFTEEKVNKEYSDEYIIAEYQKRSKYKNFTNAQILENWRELKKKKRIFFINEYKYCFFWNDKPYTRYATNKVLPGL